MKTAQTVQPDITLLLDMDGTIREATVSPSMSGECVDDWLGRSWVDIAGDKVQRLVDDARESGISAFRQVNQRFPSGIEIPIEFTTVLLGGRAGMLAVGKNLKAVAELQSRLIAAQQTMERDYWKLREIETRYRMVFDASHEAVIILSASNFRVVEANRAASDALNFSQRRNSSLVGRDLLGEIAAEDRETVRDMLERIRERGKALSILIHFGPESKPWMLRGSLMTNGSDQVFLLQFTPATNLPADAGQLKSSPVEELIDRAPDAFVAIDAAGIIRHANQAFVDLVQVGAKASVLGEPLSRWLSQPGADVQVLLANVQRYRSVRLFTTTIVGELGTETEIEISAAAGEDDESNLTGVLFRDIARRLASNAGADPLHNALESITEQIGKSSLRNLVKNTVSIVEQHYVKEALELAGGNRTATAELLGLSRQSLYAKLNRYSLDDKGQDIEETSEG